MKTFKLYTSRLNPKQTRLWQTPLNSVGWETTEWYSEERLGKNKIQALMPTLVKKANLSNKILTNHCICSTCITLLDNSGFEARHIMAISGHKKEESNKALGFMVYTGLITL